MKKKNVVAMLAIALMMVVVAFIGKNTSAHAESRNVELQAQAKRVAAYLKTDSCNDREVSPTAISSGIEITGSAIEISGPAIEIIIEPIAPLPLPHIGPITPIIIEPIIVEPAPEGTISVYQFPKEESEEVEDELILEARQIGIIDKYTKFEPNKACTFGRFIHMLYAAVSRKGEISTYYSREKAIKRFREEYPEMRKIEHSQIMTSNLANEIMSLVMGNHYTSNQTSGSRMSRAEALQFIYHALSQGAWPLNG